MATGANQQQAGMYLPAKRTIGNQAIKPMQTTQQTVTDQPLDPVTGRPVDQAGFGMPSQPKQPANATGVGDAAPTYTQPQTSTATGTSSGNTTGTNNTAAQGTGLLSPITVTQPQQPDAPTMTVPQTDFTANPYQSNGYTGTQTNTNYSYDPRNESLVQNQLTGLLDPNSALMQRTVSQTQAQAAGRGLQSSSLAAGAGMGAMIDRALPIAQQDAQTYGNADQLGWQQGFNAEMANADRNQQALMLDKQGQLQTDLQNNQYSFENTQQNASRDMQAALADLQYKQQLGTLDYQGQIQLRSMERGAQIDQQRDLLMQRFNDMNMDKSFLQQLQLTQVQNDQQDKMFEKQVGAQAGLDYRNAVSTGYNYYLEQVSAVYGNPNMTPEQQAAGVAKLGQLFEQQRLQLQAIYGFASTGNGAPPNDIGIWTGNPATNPGTVIQGPVQGPATGGQATTPSPTVGGGKLPTTPSPVYDTPPGNEGGLLGFDPQMYYQTR